MFVIDIEMFRPLADFTNDADTLTTLLKALPRQAGFGEVTMPGERSQRTEARRRKNGIPIPAKLWQELEKIGQKHNVKMPAALSAPA
jgi:LDH2 family malate/lactate/ureidoglycolate dehydrogenase